MVFRRIRRALRRDRRLPYGRCFVSLAYDDEPAIERLRERVRGRARLTVFPPITVPPEQMVSNDLLRAIRECDTLVYLKGGRSARSPWVTLERDYALRSGMDVYGFDPASLAIEKDGSAPLHLPVFPSYSRKDGDRVERLLKIMRDERSFDIFLDRDDLAPGMEIQQTLTRAIDDRLASGGYLALFWSLQASTSMWVREETKRVLERYPDRVMPALLDPVELPASVNDVASVTLYREDGRGIDLRRLDDLIVRLYWLIHRNTTTTAPAG